MIRKLTFAIAVMALAVTASAQEKKLTVADFAGTWNIEVMSHQIALVVEPKDDTKVDATLMIMGRDQLLTGEVIDGVLTLAGVKPQGAEGDSGAAGPHSVPSSNQNGERPLVITLNEDGTISGEMTTQMGVTKFTGEKLKATKKE